MKTENTAQRLKKEWNVPCKGQFYSVTGTHYEKSRKFPGALFDENGYIIFETEKEFINCPVTNIQKALTIGGGGISNIPGYVRVKLPWSVKQEFLTKKYGAGGEGVEHKRLKEWIANNPMSVGIQNVRATEVEHSYLSGDSVDILFELKTNVDVVIEIETTDPLPGCHQAIKYRALRCAERDLSLSSNEIQAMIVAWKMPEHVIKFCKKYNIRHIEMKI